MESCCSNDELKKVVANRIRKIREYKKISQLQFLCDTNIHIGRIEMGKTNITIETLADICAYLNVTLSSLLEDIEQN